MSITLTQYLNEYHPPYTKVKGGWGAIMTEEGLREAFKENRNIIIKMDGNYFRHRLCPFIWTPNDDGEGKQGECMTKNSFEDYKQFIVTLFKKRQIYECKENE